MSRPPVPHKAILASAGSGKTFTLSHRYIGLLARGVHPERIVALTFTRKAAGEIFDSIVGVLCRAAGSEEEARSVSRHTGVELNSAGCLRILSALLDRIHRVRVGTIDSFIIGMLRCFPDAVGVPQDFTLFDGDGEEARAVHGRVLEGVMARGEGRAGERRAFLSAFRQATFGREEKGLWRILDETLRRCQQIYRTAADPALWGGTDRIWERRPWWMEEAGEPAEAARGLLALLEAEGVREGAMRRWKTFAATAGSWNYGSLWTKDVSYLFEKLAPRRRELASGETELTVDYRKFTLSPAAGRAALALVDHVIRTEILGALERTRGLFGLVERYEREYCRLIRKTGRLSFDDAQHLLGLQWRGGARGEGEGAGPWARLEQRLDSPLEHWLLDEFQDTSDAQWEVFSGVAGEILGDLSGRRSFFLVGDVKQAIYGWRGGNAGLFKEILDRHDEGIERGTLDRSFRSCPAVIAAVNAVFGDFQSGGLPAGTVSSWREVWEKHTFEGEKVPAEGYAALLEPPNRDGGKSSEEERFRVAAAIVNDMKPGARGLTAGVLVRGNDTGRRVADFLRRECPGEQVVLEGRAALRDNPVVSLLLSLVRFAHHPGDTIAMRHLQMSPLGHEVEKLREGGGQAAAGLLRSIEEAGYRFFVQEWGGRLERAVALDAFGKMRLAELEAAAVEFDGGGRWRGDEFLDFIDCREIREPAGGGAVRVMTVHQAKGLGFDVVILPDLQRTGMFRHRGSEPAAPRDRRTGGARWVMQLPRRDVALLDDTLAGEIARRDEEASFEELCVLYVAMTRAREGLFLVTSFPGRNSTATTAASIVKERLARQEAEGGGTKLVLGGEELDCLFERGTRGWYESREEGPGRGGAEVRPAEERPPRPPSGRRRPEKVVPSGREQARFSASWLFDAASRDTLDFGEGIHELFGRVEWIDGFDAAGETDRWKEETRLAPVIRSAVTEQFLGALASEPFRRCLSLPGGDVELWREKSFDVVLGDRWVSGTFDRVVISGGGPRGPRSAVIMDFKSDRVAAPADLEKAVERYRPQMELYRQALAGILGIAETKIGLKLLFTAPALVREIAGDEAPGEAPGKAGEGGSR